jgi:hypothetical protein
VENTLPCTDSEEPVNFEVYSLGDSVAGLDATSVSRHCAELQPEATVRPNFVSYIYGTCPELDNGATPMCAPPLEIQTWPACERSLADYELAPGTPYPYEALGDLKGVPAYSFDQGTRIELYAGNVTIVIFAGDPALAQQAVASIQPEPTAQPPAEPTSAAAGAELPEPESGAISGELSCA